MTCSVLSHRGLLNWTFSAVMIASGSSIKIESPLSPLTTGLFHDKLLTLATPTRSGILQIPVTGGHFPPTSLPTQDRSKKWHDYKRPQVEPVTSNRLCPQL